MDGLDVGRRFMIGPLGADVGRTAPAEIVLADSEVSRRHCRLAMRGDELFVTDLNSTNGTFVDGERVTDTAPIPVGAVLQVGHKILKHEWRSQREIDQSEELSRDLEKANSYVQALLPPPLREGPIRADWLYEPCAALGGDAFGYGPFGDHQFLIYLMDVSGHGAGAAMHSVSVMNLLRQRALPNTDMAEPAKVLAALNALYQMEQHADMYFTLWYGVYDTVTRQLDYGSAGHHPAYLTMADRQETIPMRTRGGIIGAYPEARYTADSVVVPPGATVYLFSDGVFEIVTKDGTQWALDDFLPLISQPPVDGSTECQRLYRAVQSLARPGGLDDDFSLVVLTFD
jgi:serine phosphatase RsbU (regulator of sigma subunit)